MRESRSAHAPISAGNGPVTPPPDCGAWRVLILKFSGGAVAPSWPARQRLPHRDDEFVSLDAFLPTNLIPFLPAVLLK